MVGRDCSLPRTLSQFQELLLLSDHRHLNPNVRMFSWTRLVILVITKTRWMMTDQSSSICPWSLPTRPLALGSMFEVWRVQWQKMKKSGIWCPSNQQMTSSKLLVGTSFPFYPLRYQVEGRAQRSQRGRRRRHHHLVGRRLPSLPLSPHVALPNIACRQIARHLPPYT
jgi:hypothetical protein